MKKSFLALMLAVALVSLSACGNQEKAPEATATPVVTEAPTEEPTAEPTEEPTAEPTEVPTAAPTAEPTEAPEVSDTPVESEQPSETELAYSTPLSPINCGIISIAGMRKSPCLEIDTKVATCGFPIELKYMLTSIWKPPKSANILQAFIAIAP